MFFKIKKIKNNKLTKYLFTPMLIMLQKVRRVSNPTLSEDLIQVINKLYGVIEGFWLDK